MSSFKKLPVCLKLNKKELSFSPFFINRIKFYGFYKKVTFFGLTSQICNACLCYFYLHVHFTKRITLSSVNAHSFMKLINCINTSICSKFLGLKQSIEKICFDPSMPSIY